jgi:hypothetical protein
MVILLRAKRLVFPHFLRLLRLWGGGTLRPIFERPRASPSVPGRWGGRWENARFQRPASLCKVFVHNSLRQIMPGGDAGDARKCPTGCCALCNGACRSAWRSCWPSPATRPSVTTGCHWSLGSKSRLAVAPAAVLDQADAPGRGAGWAFSIIGKCRKSSNGITIRRLPTEFCGSIRG